MSSSENSIFDVLWCTLHGYSLICTNAIYFRELCNEALIEHDFLETSRTLDESGNAAARDRLSEQLELLGRVFSKAAEADKLTEVSLIILFSRGIFIALWIVDNYSRDWYYIDII